MVSPCSLILILEQWLYSIWFPRVWAITSITNLKCHPDSKIGFQAVYTFRNTNILISSSSLEKTSSSVSHGPCQEPYWLLYINILQCTIHSPPKEALHSEDPFKSLLQLTLGTNISPKYSCKIMTECKFYSQNRCPGTVSMIVNLDVNLIGLRAT